MRQKLREKAKENSGMLGLLGAGAGLASLGGGGNWFTNLLPENPFKNNDNKGDGNGENNNTQFSEENPPEGIRRVLTGLVDFVMFGTTDMDYRGDLFGNGEENTDGDGEEIKEGINTYGDGEEITEGTNTYGNGDKVEGKNQWWDFLDLFPNNKKENNEQIIGANSGFRHVTTTNVNNMALGLGGFIPGDGKGGSTYGDPDYDPYSAFKLTNTTDNNSNNEVIDGGTTVIEGGTEVVDGGTVGNNQRGEVVAQVDIVKSANSPVTAVKLSESNSIKELAIGA